MVPASMAGTRSARATPAGSAARFAPHAASSFAASAGQPVGTHAHVLEALGVGARAHRIEPGAGTAHIAGKQSQVGGGTDGLDGLRALAKTGSDEDRGRARLGEVDGGGFQHFGVHTGDGRFGGDVDTGQRGSRERRSPQCWRR